MKSLHRNLAVAFALLGLGSASTSFYVHYQLLHRPGYTSFCDVNALFSCTNAYLSRFGSLAGIPTALFGMLWFAFVLLALIVFARRASPLAASTPAYLFVLSTLALAWIMYLGYAAFFILKAVCVLCLITYVAVIGLFVVSGISTTIPMTTLPRRFVSDLKVLVSRPAELGALALFLAVAGTSLALSPRVSASASGLVAPGAGPATSADAGQAVSQQAEFERTFYAQPRMALPVPNGGARVLIVKFTDYQCPSCSQSHLSDKPVLAKFESLYPGAVRMVVKNFPLESECNDAVRSDVHMAACEAAASVVMARARGRDEALRDYFATNYTLLSPASVREAARTIGLVPDFDAQYARALNEVRTDVGLGRLVNVRVTPTYFFNGIRWEGGLMPQWLEWAITLELQKAGVSK